MSPAAKTYYPYLDKLRVFLTCLVIFHHTAIAFGASGGWYYKSPDLWSVCSAYKVCCPTSTVETAAKPVINTKADNHK